MGALSTEKKLVQSEGLRSVALERHYSVPEVASLWGISEKTVRRLFGGEDGVLRWGSAETSRKRGYQNIRIPESVLIRVHYRRERA
jgi:AraC-like DNA-binding protein